MKTRLRSSSMNPRSINRSLFNQPFTPTVNLAIEDPLLLSTHPCVQKEGLSYAKYFCANSPLSKMAPEFLKKKLSIEKNFSNKIQMESSLILPFKENYCSLIAKAFLSSQQFYVPDSILSPFPSSQTIYFSHSSVNSLTSMLKQNQTDQMPVIYMPKVCPINGRIDFCLWKSIKEKQPFFLIVEDQYTFGIEGLNGFSYKTEHAIVDLLITHIPKTFGKLLTICSGSCNLLDTLLEYSFVHSSLFPPAAYLGMFDASINILESLSDRRNALKSFITKIKQKFDHNISVYNPLLTFHLHSVEEKLNFTKCLVDKGFLLPSSAFKNEHGMITFHLNHLLEEKSISSIHALKDSFSNHNICESI